MSGGVPWDAVQRLGRFAGLREVGDRIFKSEDSEDPDFSQLPAEVQDALVVIGRLAPDAVEKSEQPETQAGIWQRIENAASANDLTVTAYLDTAQGEALFARWAVEPVEKAEFPRTKADADAAKAKADGGAAKRLQPGEGRRMASDVIAEDVKRIRKEHPNWSEAETWSWALENDQHAIDTYSRGEIAEAQSRKA